MLPISEPRKEPMPPMMTITNASITTVVKEESNRFQRTIEAGIEQFEKVAGRYHSVLSGEDAFKLHDTFGFPLELTRELANERGIAVERPAAQDGERDASGDNHRRSLNLLLAESGTA